jgi:fucose permease
VETGYGSYVTAYSVLYVGSSESRGQLLAGGYWAAIMVGRFASIFIASHVSASLFLRASMLASAASALFLLLAGSSDTGLWLGSLVFGLAMACVYPTTLSLVESFFPVLGRHVTCIMIGSASGEMALPFVIATLFGNAEELSAQHSSSSGHSPQVLMWVIAVFCAINAALLYLLLAFGKQVQEKLAATAAEQQAVTVVQPSI